MNLWEFSLSVYGKSGVPDACLTLQNSHGLDVNLVLFCLWLATDSRCLAGAEVEEAIALSNVKAVELEAERWQQQMLTSLVGRSQTSEDNNLRGFSASLDLIAAQSKSCERAWNESIVFIADAHSDDFGKKVRSVLSPFQSNR